MTTTCRPHVSFVLATYNRREVAARTLERLRRCGLDRCDYEIIVVDNASDDGTVDAVAEHADVLIRLRRNAGSCAKADGVERATGRYIVFLDDDAYPRPGSTAKLIERFENEPDLGAAGFTVHLPDGRKEGGALPGVFVGCGVGLRTEALRGVGGLDRSFFMQAEEYDLAFRLVGAGWRVHVFDDLHVEHVKTVHTRSSNRTIFYDTRNNLRLAARYLPAPQSKLYRDDWLCRYAWLAQRAGHVGSFARGVAAGLWLSRLERRTYRRRRLSGEPLEFFFRWEEMRQRMAALAASGVREVVLADLGKNILAYHRAAAQTGIKLLAIGDDCFYAPDRFYRGVPILPLDDALRLRPDAVVVGNMSAVHGTDTDDRLVARGCRPVYHWFGSGDDVVDDGIGSATTVQIADDKRAGRAVALGV